MKRSYISLICVVVVWACAGQTPGEAAQTRRVMPPPSLACDRNQLTSYTGSIQRYERSDDRLLVVISTDAETVERVEFELAAGERWGDRMLINSEAFEDFSSIENSDGTLLPGMRVIAWVCEDPDTGPVIDWRPAVTRQRL